MAHLNHQLALDGKGLNSDLMEDEVVRGRVAAAEVQPCPFCGTTPTEEPWPVGGNGRTLISCQNHECSVAPCATGETDADAIEHWNRRANEARKVC